MKIFCDITINLPRDAVVAYFSDPKIIPEWQKGFVRMEYVSGELGKPGNVHKLIYDQNGREEVMVETIEVNDLPDRFVSTNSADKVWNRIENDFTATPDGGTHWQMTAEFRGKGMVRLFMLLRPGMFRKYVLASMNDFKRYVESL